MPLCVEVPVQYSIASDDVDKSLFFMNAIVSKNGSVESLLKPIAIHPVLPA